MVTNYVPPLMKFLLQLKIDIKMELFPSYEGKMVYASSGMNGSSKS